MTENNYRTRARALPTADSKHEANDSGPMREGGIVALLAVVRTGWVGGPQSPWSDVTAAAVTR